MNTVHLGFSSPLGMILLFSSFSLISCYIFGGIYSHRHKHFTPWPLYRYLLFVSGIMLSLLGMVGPIAVLAHHDFTYHMIGHLLLGMLGPLLIVLSAPITLILRSLPTRHARSVSTFLRSNYIMIITHPVVASCLNIGGLWLLYTTNLFSLMHEYFFIHLLIHIHIFLAGYLFTSAMIYIDPVAHRFPFYYRAITFIIAIGLHQMLAKHIYAYPPESVPRVQAEAGALWMFYGGDAIDLIIIIVMCYKWYKSLSHIPLDRPISFSTYH